MIKLVSIDMIHGDEENPRKNDQWRLELTEMSLRKLGWLLPIYVDEEGMIVSGHQRTLCATKLGFKKIPVVVVKMRREDKRRSTNLLFNRATNEFNKQSFGDDIVKRLKKASEEMETINIPDITPDTKDSYPCLYHVKMVDTKQLAAKNFKMFDSHKASLAKRLIQNVKDIMPIIVTEDGDVINGIGRLQYAVETGKKVVKCISVREDQRELADVMLNLLSMDFDVNGDYADVLRYSSYMRPRNVREYDPVSKKFALADGFFKGIYPNNKGRDFVDMPEEFVNAFIKKYGDSIVDFGAGKLENTRKLREAGINVSAFEPYFVGDGENISKQKSLEINRRFLCEVSDGRKFDSVFMTNVFNSVPFIKDRKNVAIITAALCYPNGKLVCWCQSYKSAQFRGALKSASSRKQLGFKMDYEKNTILTGVGQVPKIQKGHTKEELEEIFNPCFGSIDRIEIINTCFYVECSDPKIDLEKLRKALEFEFELPYPDGSRMGLSEEAIAAFSERLGMEL